MMMFPSDPPLRLSIFKSVVGDRSGSYRPERQGDLWAEKGTKVHLAVSTTLTCLVFLTLPYTLDDLSCLIEDDECTK